MSVAARPGASPRVHRAVLFTGLALGTCLVTLAYMDGARPAVPGMPHWLGIVAGAVLAWLACAAIVAALAELLRRHYKALAVHTARHGKRGTIAAARMAGKGGRSAGSRLASWAGPRWAARRPADSAWLRPGEKRCRGCRGTGRGKDGTLTCPACRGFGSAPPDPDAPEAASGTVCTACGRPASPDDPVLADGGGPVHRSHAREQQASYDAALSGNPQQGDDVDVRAEVWRLRREAEVANLRGDKAAAGELETRACDLEATLQHPSPAERARMDAWPRARAANAWLEGRGPRPAWLDEPHDPASAPASAVPAQNGDSTMTTPAPPANAGTVSARANAPAVWKALAANTADFEPEDDGDLMAFMASEVAGISQYAEALIAVYESCVDSIGLDPVAMSAVHDVADAAAECATAMAYARQKFAAHYAEVREAVSAGLQLPFNGRWITGEGEA